MTVYQLDTNVASELSRAPQGQAALDAVSVTGNALEFKRVNGLRLENWIR